MTNTNNENHSCFHCPEHGGRRPAALEAGFGVRNFFGQSGHVCETIPHGGGDGLRLGLLPSVLVGFGIFLSSLPRLSSIFRRMPPGAEWGPLKLLNGCSLSELHIHINTHVYVCTHTHIQTHGIKTCVVLKMSVIRETGGV